MGPVVDFAEAETDDVPPQIGRNVRQRREEIVETFIHCVPYLGFPKVLNTVFAAKEVFAEG